MIGFMTNILWPERSVTDFTTSNTQATRSGWGKHLGPDHTREVQDDPEPPAGENR